MNREREDERRSQRRAKGGLQTSRKRVTREGKEGCKRGKRGEQQIKREEEGATKKRAANKRKKVWRKMGSLKSKPCLINFKNLKIYFKDE